jgi:hypothetical protein
MAFVPAHFTSSLRYMIEVAKPDVWSHWTTLHGAPFSQINCQNCAVWTSRTILSKTMLYRSEEMNISPLGAVLDSWKEQ